MFFLFLIQYIVFNHVYIYELKSNQQLTRIYFSESPRHLLTNKLAVTLMNVQLHSVAAALANIVLPVSEIFVKVSET